MKRIGIYLRVSTQEQSTDLQAREIQAFLQAKGWAGESIILYEDHGCTGTNGNRPELKRMLADIRERRLDLVIAWKLDRLFRSLKDLISTLQEFGTLGVEFISLKDNVDLSTSAGRLMMHLIGAFAEFEASLIKERTVAGMQAAKRRGVRMGPRPKPRDVQAIETLRSQGLTVREIAARLGLSKTMVHRALVPRAPLSSGEAA